MSAYPEFNFSEIDDDDIAAMRRWAMRGHSEAIEDLALVADIRGETLKGRQWRETLKRSISGTKGGRATGAKAKENREDVMELYEKLRGHVSEREDSRRIASILQMSADTVRGIISRQKRKNRKKSQKSVD